MVMQQVQNPRTAATTLATPAARTSQAVDLIFGLCAVIQRFPKDAFFDPLTDTHYLHAFH
jgi:hypothetical protein